MKRGIIWVAFAVDELADKIQAVQLMEDFDKSKVFAIMPVRIFDGLVNTLHFIFSNED